LSSPRPRKKVGTVRRTMKKSGMHIIILTMYSGRCCDQHKSENEDDLVLG
jgi:hypothetical protein